ncbi:MAG: hypothetical protein HWN69_00415 [Desulfobacterales bacterium]|nr:hypothetical protein [Desulfobacterales bacterium]
MKKTFSDCPCQRAIDTEHKDLLREFRRIRKQCPALREVLVPGPILSEFEEACNAAPDNARHRSILLLALERGYLNRITSPIHSYVLKNDKPKNELTKQYRQDLQERWLRNDSEIERHRRSRIFQGRLCELQCAEWIEKQGWKITDLEALGGSQDIEARSPDGTEYSIEVKYIGQEDTDFLSLVNSLKGRSEARSVSPYVACNFMLFRVYEATKQFEESTQARIAMLVISDMTWERFDLQLKDNWIDWKSPRFYNRDQIWQNFLQEQKKRYPDIENNLQTALNSVTELWIIRSKNGFEYSKEHVVPLSGCT